MAPPPSPPWRRHSRRRALSPPPASSDHASVARNLLADLPDAAAGEVFADLLVRPGCRIERIVSAGQTTPADRPYRQAHDEWVLLLAGAARLAMAGVEIALSPGDALLIPAGTEHRVTYTDAGGPTVWLAVHAGEPARSAT